MRTRMDPVVLWGRAVLLAAVVLLLGVAGHAAGDGLLPTPPAIVGLGAVTTLGCAAFLARPAGRRTLVALTVAGQAVVHLGLTLTAGHAAGPGHHHAQPHDHAEPAGHHGAPDLLGGVVQHVTADLAMAAAHAAAAVAVGWWLAVGEQALWTVLTLAAGVVARPVDLLLALREVGRPVLDRRPTQHAEPPLLRRPDLLARSLARRGPPVLTS